MSEYESATLAARHAALLLTGVQCGLIAFGLWLMHRASNARDRQLDAAEKRHVEAMAAAEKRHAEAMRAGAERHAEAVRAGADRHAEAMTALEALLSRQTDAAQALKALIERTARKEPPR